MLTVIQLMVTGLSGREVWFCQGVVTVKIDYREIL